MPDITLTELESLTERAASPKTVDNGKPFVVIPEKCKLEDLERLLPGPTRKTGAPVFTRAASFCEYVNEQKEPETRLYITGPTVLVAVINHHGPDDAGWGDHRATFHLTRTREWTVWTNLNGKAMDQRSFAQFIDDNSEDVSSPTGTNLLELIRTIKTSQRLELSGEVNEENQQTGSVFKVFGQTKAGAKEEVELPSEFTIDLCPYEGSDSLIVRARLRLEINNGRMTLRYELVKIDKIEREALESIVKGVEAETELTGWYGQP